MNDPRADFILPHELPDALDRPGYRDADIAVLSLDCFDTLLWRDCHVPTDIFANFGAITPAQRASAEARARRAAEIGRRRREVSIAEIYAELMPNAAEDEREAAITAELAAEARHCYAFAPTVALMREAKARGAQVVVVSDTYLDATQLRQLIADAAGEAVAALIDRVFCSSGFGLSKGEGLYREVLRKLGVRPAQVLHIGDNRAADVDGVARFGVHTLHLRQFTEGCERQLRLEASMAAMFDGVATGALGTPQPHRAALAAHLPVLTDDAEALGFATLGPVLCAFEQWLRAEAYALGRAASRRGVAGQGGGGGGRVHWLFLMRDGFLPMEVHAAMPAAEDIRAHAVEISRFTATAASFDREAKVQAYLARELGLNPATLARQLLLAPPEIARLTGGRSAQEASIAMLREVRGGTRQRAIVRTSRAFAQRLVAHVRQKVRPAPGDTLMLVDLGYNGSVQNDIDALLARELQVHVAGRYLLLRERDCPGLDKRGFIDAEHYDPHALEALCANVAVLEQLATAPTGSVTDYTDAGEPVRGAIDAKGVQSATRDRVQAGCLAYARAHDAACLRRAVPADAAALRRRAATAALARLMYLPMPEELAVLAGFQHDVNLGSARTVALFDPAIARGALRERGLFYMRCADRMYLPAELSGAGLAPKLTLLASKRFGLPLTIQDFADAHVTVPTIHADREGVTAGEVRASATHDGYYLAAVAIGDCRYSVALQFGLGCEWLEIAGVTAVPVDAFIAGDDARDDGARVTLEPVLDGIVAEAPGLYRCREDGFVMIHPPERRDDRAMLVAVVFRPVVARAPRAVEAAPAGLRNELQITAMAIGAHA